MTTDTDGTATDCDPEGAGTAPVVALDAAGAGSGAAGTGCLPGLAAVRTLADKPKKKLPALSYVW